MEIIYFFLFMLVLTFVGWLGNAIGERIKHSKKLQQEYEEKTRQIEEDYCSKLEQLEEHREAQEILFKEKSLGFPWLARAYADYIELQGLRLAEHLETKKHPAVKAADLIRESSTRRVRAERLWRILRYKLEYYETLFPWLIEFEGEDLDELIRNILEPTPADVPDEERDPVSNWLTEAEYRSLSTVDRNQRALDRYCSRSKKRWEIGRDYERYIGYLFDMDGWNVEYHGIVEGLADLGRDLIATRADRIVIVQCKCWSSEKRIHEKHVFQLFGTVEAYKLDHGTNTVQGLLVTSTELSDRAKRVADHLKLPYWQNKTLERYALIKCNVSHRDGTKIYHLPFDQQYDRTTIDEQRRECYVETVAEAEQLGFRRAWRWRGSQSDGGNEQGTLFAGLGN